MEKKDTIYIIGHKHPDTDTIAASMAYAELKNKLGVHCVAGRLGTLNEETKFATRKFDVEAPMLMTDARSQLRDLKLDKPTTLKETDSVHDAFQCIEKTHNQSLFIVNGEGKLQGIVSISDLFKIHQKGMPASLKQTTIPLLKKTLKAKSVGTVESFKPSGKVVLETGTTQKEKLARALWVVGKLDASIMQGIKEKPAALILCQVTATPALKKACKANQVALLETKLNPLKVLTILPEALALTSIMTRNTVAYHQLDYVDDVALKIAKTRYRSYPVLDQKGKVVGAVSRYHLFRYPKKKFILVDHSAKNQTIDYIDEAEILEIVDHHHIGNIETDKPIFYRNQQCGCTCTIIGQLFEENKRVPSTKTAGMMLSAIISDTLGFQSKTTTDTDRRMAKKLAARAKVNLKTYTQELLKASVSLKTVDPYELLLRDLKQYEFAGHKVGVGQTNYSDLGELQSRLEDFRKILDKEQTQSHYDLLILMFTHVLGEGTYFLFAGPLSYVMPEVIETPLSKDSGFDHGIMSRKQQLIPVLSQIVKEQ